MASADIVSQLQDAANRMRVSSIEQTCKSNSGHPTSSSSAAEIMATLFFAEMRYDVKYPRHPAADRFILSKVYLYWFKIFMKINLGSCLPHSLCCLGGGRSAYQ